VLRGARPELLAGLVVAGAWAGACGGAARLQERASITFAVRADVTGFFPNPPIVSEGFTFDINYHLFEGLVRFGPSMAVEPAIAQHWENPDDRTVVFRLRPDVHFSDGRPVTPQDVVASLRAARDRHWVNRDSLLAVESVEALDERRVQIRTRYPHLVLLSRLPRAFIQPAEVVAATPVPTLGTGPYRLEAWSPGKGFTLTRNEHYHDTPPAFARASFVVVPEARERVERLLSGKADVADQIPLDALDDLERRPEVKVFAGPGSRVLFLCLRVDTPPFRDARVREAADLAIDRDRLIRKVFHGRSQAASQVVPPGIVGFNPQIPVTRPDPERARRLLAEAGYPQGFAVRLDGPNNRYAMDRETLAEVAQQLGEVGIRVSVNAQDKSAFFGLLDARQSAFHLLGWGSETGEAGDALVTLFRTPSGGVLGVENSVALSDPELDRLIDESNRSLSLRDRTALLQAALARVAELRPVIPLVVQTETLAVSRRVVWEPRAQFRLSLRDFRPAP